MSRKLVSFSLFGPHVDYHVGALKNVRLYSQLLPDYTCRLYVGDKVPTVIIDKLLDLGAEVHLKKGWREDWTATMWRFHALTDQKVSHFIFRDCDSRPSAREVAAVRAWEDSFKGFHVMRDHPAHHAVMLAGMWGVTQHYAPQLVKALPEQMRPSSDYHEHYDQAFLANQVWPLAQRDSLVHASFWTTYFGPTEDFPTPRVGNEFVGEGLTGDDLPRYPTPDLRTCCSSCNCSLGCDRREGGVRNPLHRRHR